MVVRKRRMLYNRVIMLLDEFHFIPELRMHTVLISRGENKRNKKDLQSSYIPYSETFKISF